MNKFISFSGIISFFALFLSVSVPAAHGKDFQIKGSVTDNSGNIIPGAAVTISAGNREFHAVSGTDGFYSLRIPGVYSSISGLLESGNPYPNPFFNGVHLPFIINSPGDVRFAVYSLAGQKISETVFRSVGAGSYNIFWDGRNSIRSTVPRGFYIYSITFGGETRSGRLIKVSGEQSASTGTYLESVMLPPVPYFPAEQIRIRTIASVSRVDYYPVRLTDIVISRDTVIDFELEGIQSMPFRAIGDHIARLINSEYKSLILKGINLGAAPPGTFPGEIAYAISDETYEKWIGMIGKAGFNCIRIYTLHPPVFYEKLANYNYRHPDDPILLFQGAWLGETGDPSDPSEYDLMQRKPSFVAEMQEVIDCIHGKRNIAFRYGRAYGNYITDVSRWTAGLILGREISPFEIGKTDLFNSSVSSYEGYQFSISEASPSEVFVTQMLDEAVRYEISNYSVNRPVSISSWPTLDPLDHPTEIYTDEDKASIDIYKITGKSDMAGLFATYHAYPYYPNFISQQSSYLSYSDSEGANSYYGYLSNLKDHYSGIPLVIGEFGVPSSWGSAHWSFSKMEHGGYSEEQQGEKNIRMMHNILDAGCAGGFMFSWMDEWFKPTWIVQYLEAFGFNPGSGIIPTRQLWHNLASPEQNFGLVAFDQAVTLPFAGFQGNYASGSVSKASATHDNAFFYADIDFKEPLQTGDTVIIAFDTYSASTGESMLPNGKSLTNRSEFMLLAVAGSDTAMHYVTEAYDMDGLSPRFNLTDPAVQKFRSTISDGSPWKLMRWINDGDELKTSNVGLLPMENSREFTYGERCAVAWSGNQMKIRIPWTLLYFYDPTQMQVIDGAISNDGGWTHSIIPQQSDGIALSVYFKGTVTSASSRYNWDKWLVVPATRAREKKSLHLVETGLSLIPDFAN